MHPAAHSAALRLVRSCMASCWKASSCRLEELVAESMMLAPARARPGPCCMHRQHMHAYCRAAIGPREKPQPARLTAHAHPTTVRREHDDAGMLRFLVATLSSEILKTLAGSATSWQAAPPGWQAAPAGWQAAPPLQLQLHLPPRLPDASRMPPDASRMPGRGRPFEFVRAHPAVRRLPGAGPGHARGTAQR